MMPATIGIHVGPLIQDHQKVFSEILEIMRAIPEDKRDSALGIEALKTYVNTVNVGPVSIQDCTVGLPDGGGASGGIGLS